MLKMKLILADLAEKLGLHVTPRALVSRNRRRRGLSANSMEARLRGALPSRLRRRRLSLAQGENSLVEHDLIVRNFGRRIADEYARWYNGKAEPTQGCVAVRDYLEARRLAS